MQFPSSFVGKYFFADLCSGWIRVFDPATGTASAFASGISQPVDLQVGNDGSLYYLSIGAGSVFRVRFNSPQGSKPIIATEEGSDIAIALDSPTMLRDPFALVNPFNFGVDNRTTLSLFVKQLDLLPGEDKSAVTARFQDAAVNVFPLEVEFVGKLPGVEEFSQVIVRLPANTPANQPIFVSVTLRGQTSNLARIRMK